MKEVKEKNPNFISPLMFISFVAKPLPKDHKWEYIGGGLGGGAVVIIVVIVIVSVVCYRSKLRSGATRVKVIFHSI